MIELTISNSSYSSKSDSLESARSGKMTFTRKDVTLGEFQDMILQGYNFAGLYSDDSFDISKKTKDNFIGSQFVCVDVDRTQYNSMRDYIDRLKLKPSLAYCTPSDTDTDRRFRLVYAFREMMTQPEFVSVSNQISDLIEYNTGEKLYDRCGTYPAQFFCGSTTSTENYKSDLFYSKYDFDLSSSDEEISGHNISVSSDVRAMLRLYSGLPEKEFRKTSTWMMFRNVHPYFFRTEGEDWLFGQYQYTDPDKQYICLPYYKEMRIDGEHRRKTLFKRMCMRRLIKPDCTVTDLIVNAIEDILMMFNNSDNALNAKFLIRNTVSAMEQEISDIERIYKDELAVMQQMRPEKIYLKGQHNKETTFEILDSMWNSRMPIKGNIEIIRDEIGYDVSVAMIYQYCKERGIISDCENFSDSDIISAIDYTISARKNYKQLKDSGVSISWDRFSKLYRENKQ